MAYGLKYRADFRNTRGHEYRVSIYQRDYTGGWKTMGDLCGCILEIQGAQGRIIDPIVKTQLRVSMVDSWDEPDTETVKHGDWQEFFTPDATLYKVVLSELTGAPTATDIWSGYITPDSWQEDLDYRGTITITARDNIGHLKDFPFVADGSVTPDENGLIELRWLWSRAMQIIDLPMAFYWDAEGTGQYSAEVPESDAGDYLTDALINASLFEGMDWYEALESSLEAVGFALRYVGNNTVVACSLRNLPKMGHYNSPTETQALEFYGGTLELDPAVKQIEEDVEYGFEPNTESDIRTGIEFASTSPTYKAKVDGKGPGTVLDYGVRICPYNKLTQSGCAFSQDSDSINPARFPASSSLLKQEGDSWNKYPMFPANYYVTGESGQDPAPSCYFHIRVHDTAMVLRVRLADPLTLIGGKFTKPVFSLASITYSLRYLVGADSSEVRYWDGEFWVENSYPITITQTFEYRKQFTRELVFSLPGITDLDVDGFLTLAIWDMQYKICQFVPEAVGVYARFRSITIETRGTQLKSDKVTTINNTAYNVKIERRPIFGALSVDAGWNLPGNYKKALFYYPVINYSPGQFPYQVRFTDYGNTVPLPVLIHQQILCYYFGAARVLSGSCAPVNKGRYAFDKLCTYRGTTYLLQGGAMDLFSGIMTGAVLREYTDFTTLWDETPPEYSEDIKYND